MTALIGYENQESDSSNYKSWIGRNAAGMEMNKLLKWTLQRYM